MNYYIQGSPARAEEIKAAFEKLGVASNADKYNYKNRAVLYFTAGGMIHITDANGSWANIIKTHPDYKELELPVKPKFKVDGWVVYNGASVWQVNKIDRNMPIPRYELTNNDGGKLSVPFTSEYNLKEWTIQDAKDGDVLAVESIDSYPFPFVAIYKERGLNFFNSYCCIGFDGKFYESESGHSTEKIHPATKEQRDLLFAKMKEAGYVWA